MSENPPTILIVDDDDEMRAMLCSYLADHGFRAAAAVDGVAMDAWLATHTPDLILLDLMLPGEDGLALTRRLKDRGDWPIIMVSARGADIDRIIGLELGVDDYLPKPFNPRELLARIKAMLRRRPNSAQGSRHQISFGRFLLNLDAHSLTRDGAPVSLTTAEFTLLKILASNPGRVLSREALVNLAQDDERMPFERSVDVRIARLRRKIEDNPDSPRHIKTVWGSGYLFTLEGDQS